MKIKATDPDLSTIYSRIKDNSLDLQPDFQRAEVWRTPKKKLLIDTILRDWQVPPVHVILNDDLMVQEVLDGQQRLSAIRDFIDNKFRVDGRIEPFDDDLFELNGLLYSQLPSKVRNRFDRYAIRVFEILDYNQGEPGELFNRLNESLKLTSAEKRNAYVGALRTQIKKLVDELEINNIDKRFLGFSNQRMAYHDLFIKLCYMLEAGSVIASYTEKQLNDRAREDKPFSSEVINSVNVAIRIIGTAKEELETSGKIIHVTKASINSWIFFIAFQKMTSRSFNEASLVAAFVNFETDRSYYRSMNKAPSKTYSLGYEVVNELFSIFGSRSTSRVTTASSLVIRDSIISLYFYMHESDSLSCFEPSKRALIRKLVAMLSQGEAPIVALIEEFADDVVWAAAL
ncbi:hypothetical protein AO070_08700 [Pseudomonas syringae pv. syringae PD2766]|uniref:DUF262 domain-containing protein n=1 Tax=Pseudomonas syringae TaxID=317 RepID=UPI000736AAC2|nr:DUF262 domain-containing protein [Pseudomonas syringae]KTB86203.1 hypothetical protein AO070_08700 [Pseudomonas syringae pv. syringae PD2766]